MSDVLSKLYLELAKVVPKTTLSSRELDLGTRLYEQNKQIADLLNNLSKFKARVEELESLINKFCEASSWADQGWKDEPHTSPLFDVYEKWRKPSANTIERKMVTEEARDE